MENDFFFYLVMDKNHHECVDEHDEHDHPNNLHIPDRNDQIMDGQYEQQRTHVHCKLNGAPMVSSELFGTYKKKYIPYERQGNKIGRAHV